MPNEGEFERDPIGYCRRIFWRGQWHDAVRKAYGGDAFWHSPETARASARELRELFGPMDSAEHEEREAAMMAAASLDYLAKLLEKTGSRVKPPGE